MLRKFVIFLVRKNLGVKKYERFRFESQKEDATYFFTESCIMKERYGRTFMSGVSLNWLLDCDCGIILEKERDYEHRAAGLSD